MHRVIKILLLAALFTNFAEGLYTPVYAAYVEKIGGGLSDAGLSWSINLIVFGVLAMILSHMETGSKRRAGYLFLGYLLSALASALFALITAPFMLYFVQFLRGLSWAMISPVWDSFFSLYVDKKRATVEWGYYEGGWSIATGIGSALGGILVTLFSFQTLFIVSASFNLLAAVFVLINRHEFY